MKQKFYDQLDEKLIIDLTELKKLIIFPDLMKFQYLKYENEENKEKEIFEEYEYKISYEFYRAY